MATNIPEGITPEMVEQLVSSPGQTLSGFAGEPAATFAPSSSIDISQRAGKGLRPQIGGQRAGDKRIDRPSASLPLKLAAGDKARREAEAARAAEAEKQRIEHSPEKLSARISFLERANKRLEKQLKDLLKRIDG